MKYVMIKMIVIICCRELYRKMASKELLSNEYSDHVILKLDTGLLKINQLAAFREKNKHLLYAVACRLAVSKSDNPVVWQVIQRYLATRRKWVPLKVAPRVMRLTSTAITDEALKNFCAG